VFFRGQFLDILLFMTSAFRQSAIAAAATAEAFPQAILACLRSEASARRARLHRNGYGAASPL